MTESADDSENAAILQLVKLLLLDAIKKGASRIAIGRGPDPARAGTVWFELDGHPYPVMKPPEMAFEPMIGHFLDMAEIAQGPRISPTRGRIHIRMSGDRHFYFDVAAFPQGSDPAVVIVLQGRSPPESIPKLDAFRFSYPLSA
jgi:type II secretory ATPase GspE/PulE/Tfp pilus assembly ATPase PilB-like protein